MNRLFQCRQLLHAQLCNLHGHNVQTGALTFLLSICLRYNKTRFVLFLAACKLHKSFFVYLPRFFEQLHFQSELETIGVFRSSIRPPDKGGGLCFESMIEKSFGVTDWTAQFLGYLARAWYCGWVPPLDQELVRDMMSPELIQAVRHFEEPARSAEKIFGQAIQIAESIHRKCNQLKSKVLVDVLVQNELKDLADQMNELDQQIENLGIEHLPIHALGKMSKILLHHLQGSSLLELSKESIEAYRQLKQGAALLNEWTRFTLNLVKPVALTHEATVIPIYQNPH